MTTPNHDRGDVVNWDPPSKRDLVERALSDGMTDTAEIVKYAKGREVEITPAEVEQLKADLQKKKPHQH